MFLRIKSGDFKFVKDYKRYFKLEIKITFEQKDPA